MSEAREHLALVECAPATPRAADSVWASRAQLLLQSSRSALASTVARGLEDAGVSCNDHLVLMVSGGADSVAMMLLIAALRERTDHELASLSVLTINHGLRSEAVAECAFVVKLAHHLGIRDVHSESVSLPTTGNMLECAREARLNVAAKICARVFGAIVVQAHHADDRAEGVLLALMRAKGLESFATLLPMREFAGGVHIARPCLNARREELRELLRALEIEWHEDHSNALHERGALRSNPVTARLVAQIAVGASDLSDEAQQLLELRDTLAADIAPIGATTIARAVMDATAHALRAAVLRRLVHAAGGDIARPTLTAALRALRDEQRAPKSFDCAGSVRLLITAREVSTQKVSTHAVTAHEVRPHASL